jgi:HPt (histidine-containing phosphotransfer) domain-containing protein
MTPHDDPLGLEEALRELWDRTRPRVLGRVAVLEEASTALRAGALDPELRERARCEAHRLAGTLGTLGLPDASPVAKRLELLLGDDLDDDAPETLAAGAAALRAMAEAGPAA